MKRYVLLAVAGLFLAGCQDNPASLEVETSGGLAQSAAPGDRYIVVFRPETRNAPGLARQLVGQAGGRLDFTYEHAIRGFAATLPEPALAGIRANPNVAYVEVDQPVHAYVQTVPTGVQRIFADDNTNLDIDGVDDVRIDVDVAIIDTGIDLDHPDLNVVASTDCTNESGGPPWARTVTCGAGGDDDNGHGSHVAGSVGAIDDGVGVVGVAPGARLHAVKVLESNGSGSIAMIVAGIDYVTADGTIEVANMSLGCECTSQAMDDAITNSVASGVTYAVAAGNSGEDAATHSPANHPDVITVSALADFDGEPGGLGSSTCRSDQDDTLADFSNFGSLIEITAPGVCILSTWMNGGYETISGTSMASPHVAGAAALLASTGGTPASIRQALIDAGNFDWIDDSGDGTQEPLLDVSDETVFAPATVGDGGATVTDVAVTDVSAPSSVVQGDVVSVDVTVSNTGTEDVTADIDVTLTDDTDGPTIGTQTISGGLAAGASTTLTYSWDTSGSSTGDHTLTGSQDFADEDTTNDAKSTTVTVGSSLTDIAVTNVSAPASAVQGDAVSVDVTVENVGNQDVTSDFDVTLTDDTDGPTIGTQTISGGLAAGASTTLTYSWDTSGSSLGDHTLTASHDVADDDASNDSASTVVNVQEESSTSHVGDLDGNSINNGSTWVAVVTVTVHDGSHNGVSDATVSGTWSGGASGAASCTTDASGTCSISEGGIHKRNGSATFTVDDVTHGSLAYDPGLNHDPDGDSDGTSITVSKP